MKKLLPVLLGIACAVALTVNAADEKKDKSEDSKAVKKELLEKYDTNKDGKLDKDEKAKMSKEDKEKWSKIAGGHKKKGESKDSTTTTK